MCTGKELLTGVADSSKDDPVKMAFDPLDIHGKLKKPKLPPAADPQAERLKAEAEATAAANAQLASIKKARRQQSLLASGAPTGTPATTSVMAYGKDTLGA